MNTTATRPLQAPDATTSAPDLERYVTPAPAYRLPTDTRLGRVRLQVADLTRSLAYYQKVLGLRVIERTDGHAALGSNGDDTVLVELFERPGAKPVPYQGRLGLYHFAILLPSRADLARFAIHLANTGARAGASDHAVSEAFYLRDPDGLGIEVYADRPRNAWPVHDGRLGMVTEPIGMESLVREAGNEMWNGMPAGTTMGHVHLHVGDIRTAAAFFHEALGFDEVAKMPGALFLSAGGYHHHLGTNTWAASTLRPEEDEARLLEWTIIVPGLTDASAAAHSLQTAGYDATATDSGWLVADSWGTPLRIIHADNPT